MLEFQDLNYWAILVAWLVYTSVGAYWYSPAGFGKLWAKLSGVNHMKTPQDEATRSIVAVSVAALFQALVLAVVIDSLGASTMVEGLKLGVVLWFGLTALTTVGNTLYMRLGWKFWWLNSSYFLLVMTINSVILAVWQ